MSINEVNASNTSMIGGYALRKRSAEGRAVTPPRDVAADPIQNQASRFAALKNKVSQGWASFKSGAKATPGTIGSTVYKAASFAKDKFKACGSAIGNCFSKAKDAVTGFSLKGKVTSMLNTVKGFTLKGKGTAVMNSIKNFAVNHFTQRGRLAKQILAKTNDTNRAFYKHFSSIRVLEPTSPLAKAVQTAINHGGKVTAAVKGVLTRNINAALKANAPVARSSVPAEDPTPARGTRSRSSSPTPSVASSTASTHSYNLRPRVTIAAA